MIQRGPSTKGHSYPICGRTLLVVAAVFALAAAASAQTGPAALPSQEIDVWKRRPFTPGGFIGSIQSMELLKPNLGWASTGFGLYWTTDGGSSWKDITPQNTSGFCRCSDKRVQTLFFLNARRGWALMDYFEYRSRAPATPVLASTTDAGATWSQKRLRFPGFDPKQIPLPYQFPIKISFADPEHGWMLMWSPARRNADSFLLETNDAGQSWHWTPSSPTPTNRDSVLRVTQSDGWMVGYARPGPSYTQSFRLLLANLGQNELYVTHDGARTWQQISLDPPPEVSEDASAHPGPSTYVPAYDLPIFTDSAHGYLSVTYRPSWLGDKSTAVLFETHDGGRTWGPDRFLKLPPPISHPRSTVIDSIWLVYLEPQGHPTVMKVAPGAKVNADLDPAYLGPNGGILGPSPDGFHARMSFSTPTQGWLLPLNYDALLSTSDGGSTWTVINPKMALNMTREH